LKLQPRRTALAAWLALLALSTILGAASYGVPPHQPASPETGALQQGPEPQARSGSSVPTSFAAGFESQDKAEGSAPTSPRGPMSAGAFKPPTRFWVAVVASRSGQAWARR
jgi:hypothetical protein